MAEEAEPKDWASQCVDGVELEAPDAVRAMLTVQLNGVMQERPLKASEVRKLATALLEPPKEAEPAEKAG